MICPAWCLSCLGPHLLLYLLDGSLGPVVQSAVSLTSSLRVISLTVLADSIHNILIFFAEKMWVAFAVQKLLTFFQQKISTYLRITRCKIVPAPNLAKKIPGERGGSIQTSTKCCSLEQNTLSTLWPHSWVLISAQEDLRVILRKWGFHRVYVSCLIIYYRSCLHNWMMWANQWQGGGGGGWPLQQSGLSNFQSMPHDQG